MCPKGTDGMANSVDPRAVWSGSTLFAHTGLSENLGKLRKWQDLSLACIEIFKNSNLQNINAWIKKRIPYKDNLYNCMYLFVL